MFEGWSMLKLSIISTAVCWRLVKQPIIIYHQSIHMILVLCKWNKIWWKRGICQSHWLHLHCRSWCPNPIFWLYPIFLTTCLRHLLKVTHIRFFIHTIHCWNYQMQTFWWFWTGKLSKTARNSMDACRCE